MKRHCLRASTRPWLFAAAVLLVTFLAAPLATAQDNAAFAQRRLSNAIRLYDAHDYAGSLPEFRASYSLYASPNTRLYIARALRGLDRLPEAFAEYERTVSEAGDRAQTDARYVSTRDAAAAELRGVLARVGRVTVTAPGVPTDAQIEVAGVAVPVAALGVAMPVAPGHVIVTARARGYELTTAAVDVSAGQEASVVIRLRPLATPVPHTNTTASRTPPSTPLREAQPHNATRPQRSTLVPLGISGVVVGVVGFAAFGTFYYLTNQRFQQLSADCFHMPCPESDRAAINEGRMFQTLTNVSLGVGIAGAAIGGLLLMLTPLERRPPVHVSFAPGAVSITGTF